MASQVPDQVEWMNVLNRLKKFTPAYASSVLSHEMIDLPNPLSFSTLNFHPLFFPATPLLLHHHRLPPSPPSSLLFLLTSSSIFPSPSPSSLLLHLHFWRASFEHNSKEQPKKQSNEFPSTLITTTLQIMPTIMDDDVPSWLSAMMHAASWEVNFFLKFNGTVGAAAMTSRTRFTVAAWSCHRSCAASRGLCSKKRTALLILKEKLIIVNKRNWKNIYVIYTIYQICNKKIYFMFFIIVCLKKIKKFIHYVTLLLIYLLSLFIKNLWISLF